MALNDKNLIITPNIGSTTDPKIDFVGASAAVGPTTITATIYPTNNGTLSFDSSEGSVFSISGILTSGSIFSVNPISGIPIIDVNADRTIALNPFGGNTGIGTTNPTAKLDVRGNVNIVGVSTFTGGIFQLVNTVTISGGIYTLDITASNEFVTAAAINGATTINLSNLTNLPTGYRWRGVFSFSYTSGVISWFSGNAGYTVKWDGGSAPTPTAGETETVVIAVTGGGTTTIEIAPLKGRA